MPKRTHRSESRKKSLKSKKRVLQKRQLNRVEHLRHLSARQQEERVRCLAALNLYRRGEAKSVSAAARAEGTTLYAMRKLVPAAIKQDRSRARIRVTKTDQYSARVEVMTNEGIRIATAHGSRQRDLAGQHRATIMRVLRGQESPSALEKYRGKKIGGHELISNYRSLRSFAEAGEVGQLETLYVSPDTNA